MVFIFILFFLFSLFSTTTIAVNSPCSYQICVPTLPAVATATAGLTPSSCPVLVGTLTEAEIWRQEYYVGEMGSLSKNNWQPTLAVTTVSRAVMV